ncbi:hypothetical protein ROS1_27610 [Roseibium sp. ROS1]
MIGSRSFVVLDGAEEIGVVIHTEHGFEAYHHVLGFLATYQAIEDPRLPILVRGRREDAA